MSGMAFPVMVFPGVKRKQKEAAKRRKSARATRS